MKQTILTISTLTLILFACGPSKEEQAAREKAIADSVTQSIAKAKATADSIAAFNANQDALKQQLIDLKAQFEAAQARLGDVEQFKILRTADEKQQQIEEQTKIVETLRQQITDVEKQIVN